MTDPMAGVDRHYGTVETAKILGRSKQWMYYCVRRDKFLYPPVWHVRPTQSYAWHPCTEHPHDKLRGDFFSVEEPWLALSVLGESERDMEWRNADDTLRYGYFADPIQPILVGRRRRYSLPIIREIALSCYRQGNFKEAELKAVLSRIMKANEA